MINQRTSAWNTEPFYEADCPIRELSGSTVGIVGYGGIGRELGRRLTALDARVVGLRRTPADAEDGVEMVTGRHGLDRILRESDAVVVTAPDTPETRGMIDADAFARMKRDAILVNVARGAIVDESALADALREGRIRGAALDVFTAEPLPSDSPFWSLDNVLVTPHVSGVTNRFWRREVDLILHNVERWLAGDVEGMRNVVDLDAGY